MSNQQIFSKINKKIGKADNYNQDFYLLMGDIDDESIQPVIEWVITNNFPDENGERPDIMNLLICGNGGEAGPAFALIDIIQGSAVPVRTIGFGQLCSSSLMIFMSGEKGQRVLTPNTMVLSHQYSWGSGGKEHELSAAAKGFKLSSSIILNHYLKCSNLNEADIKKILLPASDVWLSAKECLKVGLCDLVQDLK